MFRFLTHRRGASQATSESTASAPPMTAKVVRSSIDDEDLAALVDGRLSDCERSKMMGRLVEEEDAYEVFACTAAMLSEEGDALLERMQSAEVRAAARRAFDASPDDLRKAAIEAARNREG